MGNLEIKEGIFNFKKNYIKMPITNSILNSKKLNVLPLRSIIRQGYLLLPLLASAIKPAIHHSNIIVFRLERKKKINCLFFTNSIIIYIENLMKYIK